MFIPVGERFAVGGTAWTWYGIGYCAPHFGEILQGKFTLDGGREERALITMPYRRRGVVSQVQARPGRGVITGTPGKSKTVRAVEHYLAHYGMQASIDVCFALPVSTNEGIGLGTSTSDIIATLRALDHALGASTPADDLARLAVKAEIASDSTMFGSSAVLFAQRRGEILERFAGRIPHLLALGFNLEPGGGFPTSETPPAEYTAAEIAEFDQLRALVRRAILRQDAALIASVATSSARINQAHFPKANFSAFLDLARTSKALGVSISHSGTVGALLFSATGAPASGRIHQLFAAATECGFEPIETFLV